MIIRVIGCWGGYPAKGGATASYIVEKDDFVLAIDMGSGALSSLQKYYDINDLDAVILSHYHHDHVADIGVLQYAKLVQTYITNTDTVLPIYGHLEDEENFQRLNHDQTKAVGYDPSQALTIGSFKITFLRTEHPVPCYGMRVTDGENTFVYTADTAYVERWAHFIKDAHMLIADCNFYASQSESAKASGHMTSSEAATIARDAGVRDLILSHLPQYGDREKLAEEAKCIFSGNVLLAYEGLTWKL